MDPPVNIDAADLVKIATGLASLGGGFAFARPFAEKLFASWLTRAERRAVAEEAREAAIVRIAATHERMVGVLEAFDRRLDRIDARLDRIEAHHGISPTPSAIPAEAPAVEPRRQLTDPALPRVEPSAPSQPGRAG
jgi:hypothetical protein